MAFDTFDPRLKAIAEKALSHCRLKYGGNALATEKEIAPEIGWEPSFHLKPSRFRIIAVEVQDNLFPEVLKGAAYDIGNYDGPIISVYQACSLNAYQNDPKQAKINLLRKHGFGIITVDEDGRVTEQHRCIPLAQHISEEELDSRLSALTPKMKVTFRAAHSTYLTNAGQGLQQAGQIVEAIIASIATQAKNKGVITPAEAGGALADVIDALYGKNVFKNHRAALGDARAFTKEFRNIASHAPKSAKDAAITIRKCKTGFLDAMNVATKLRGVAQQLGYRIQIHIAE